MTDTDELTAHADQLHRDALVFISHDHEILEPEIRRMKLGGVTAKQVHVSLDGQIFAPRDGYVSSAPRVSLEREVARMQSEGVGDPAYHHQLLCDAPTEMSSAGFLRRALVAMDYLYWIAERSGGEIRIATEPADILAAKRDNAIALVLGSEGSRLTEDRLEVLRMLARMGLRHLALSWAWDTPVGAPQGDRSGRGLSDHGRYLVQELNAIGVIVDVAHLSRQSIADVLAESTSPILMSHSGAEALNPEGGLTTLLPDEMLQEIAHQGGVVSVHFMSHMVEPGRAPAGLPALVRQFEYLAGLMGAEHVACGPDYFPLHPTTWQNPGLSGPSPFSYVTGVQSIAEFGNLTRGLVSAGLDDDTIRNILGGSMLRLFGEVRSQQVHERGAYQPFAEGVGACTDGTTPL